MLAETQPIHAQEEQVSGTVVVEKAQRLRWISEAGDPVTFAVDDYLEDFT